MAQRYTELSDKLKQFIEAQKIFFVGTATGNKTSAHVQQNPRMTLMFSAFDGKADPYCGEE